MNPTTEPNAADSQSICSSSWCSCSFDAASAAGGGEDPKGAEAKLRLALAESPDDLEVMVEYRQADLHRHDLRLTVDKTRKKQAPPAESNTAGAHPIAFP
jgi:hypothetical protein